MEDKFVTNPTVRVTLSPECCCARHAGKNVCPDCPVHAPAHWDEWNREEFLRDFQPLEWWAPWVCVRRKSDGAIGQLKFEDVPRRYFDWGPVEDS